MIGGVARVECRERRRAARFGGKPGAGRPEQRHAGDLLEVEIAFVEGHVGRGRLAVEEKGKAVRRKDLAEHDGRSQRRVRPDARRVDPELVERSPRVDTERVVADLGDHACGVAQARRRDRDVGRAAAEHLPEGAHIGKRDADLLRIEVDADPAHRENFACRSFVDPHRTPFRARPVGRDGDGERRPCVLEAARARPRLEHRIDEGGELGAIRTLEALGEAAVAPLPVGRSPGSTE